MKAYSVNWYLWVCEIWWIIWHFGKFSYLIESGLGSSLHSTGVTNVFPSCYIICEIRRGVYGESHARHSSRALYSLHFQRKNLNKGQGCWTMCSLQSLEQNSNLCCVWMWLHPQHMSPSMNSGSSQLWLWWPAVTPDARSRTVALETHHTRFRSDWLILGGMQRSDTVYLFICNYWLKLRLREGHTVSWDEERGSRVNDKQIF